MGIITVDTHDLTKIYPGDNGVLWCKEQGLCFTEACRRGSNKGRRRSHATIVCLGDNFGACMRIIGVCTVHGDHEGVEALRP